MSLLKAGRARGIIFAGTITPPRARLKPAVLGSFYHGLGAAIVQSVTPLSMRATVSAIMLFVLNLIGLGFGPLAVGAVSDGLNPIFGKESLRHALMVMALLNVWAGVHYMLAGTAFAREAKSN